MIALGALCVVMGAFIPLVGPLTGSALIGKAFVEQRGRAMGIASMGPPAGGAAFALLAGAVIPRADWRTAFGVFAAISLVLFPLIVWAIPRHLETPAAAAAGADGVWTRRRLLRTRDFYSAALAMGLTAGIATGWGAQLVPYVLDLGHELAAGSRIAAISGGVGILGTLGFGILADRFRPRRLMIVALLGCIAALAVYRTEPAYPGLLVAATLFGLCSGAVLTLYALTLTELFGAAGLGQALGLTNLFILPVGVLATVLAGWLRETSGSYALPLLVLATGLTLAVGSLLTIRSARVATEPAEPPRP